MSGGSLEWPCSQRELQSKEKRREETFGSRTFTQDWKEEEIQSLAVFSTQLLLGPASPVVQPYNEVLRRRPQVKTLWDPCSKEVLSGLVPESSRRNARGQEDGRCTALEGTWKRVTVLLGQNCARVSPGPDVVQTENWPEATINPTQKKKPGRKDDGFQQTECLWSKLPKKKGWEQRSQLQEVTGSVVPQGASEKPTNTSTWERDSCQQQLVQNVAKLAQGSAIQVMTFQTPCSPPPPAPTFRVRNLPERDGRAEVWREDGWCSHCLPLHRLWGSCLHQTTREWLSQSS